LINDEDDHEDIVRWFGLAESLHINFYEDRASYDTIRIISADVRKLVDRLDLID